MVKTQIIHSPLAVKASRGTANLWVSGSQFGVGNRPMHGVKADASHLQQVLVDLLREGYSVRVDRYE